MHRVYLVLSLILSLAEYGTVDEQKQIVLIATPVMTQDRYAQLRGLMEGQVRGQIEKGHLPSLKIGRVRMVTSQPSLSRPWTRRTGSELEYLQPLSLPDRPEPVRKDSSN